MSDSENSKSFHDSQILDIDDKFDEDEEQTNVIQQNQNINIENKKNNIQISVQKEIKEKSKAIPFIIFQDGKYIIQEQAKNILCQKSNENIGIISLVGKYRTGKSFLLNRVILNIENNSGFEVGPTFKPCTKGIWLWSEPLMIQNNHSKTPFPCYLIDTEGLGAYDEEVNHDTKIFLIAVLMSSLFIFNSFGAIDEMALNSLSFILNLSKSIKIKSINKEDNEDEFAEYFPTLLWLLRDFSLKLEDKNGNVITEKQYLENALEDINGTSDFIEEKNRVRNLIKSYFPEKDCFVMIRPVENEEDLQNLQNIPDNELRKEFVQQSNIFRNKVKKKIKPKTFKKRLISGAMLIELMQSILDSINNGSIPVIENSWRYMIQKECIKNSKEAINNFLLKINKFKEDNKNKNNFIKSMKKYMKKCSKNCISEFIKNSVLDDDNKKEYVEKLENKINNEINKFDKEIEKMLENKFNEEIDKLSDEFISNFTNDNNLYEKNYYQFLTDLETFKEKANTLTPNFPNKYDILIDKILLIINKFIDEEIIKIKRKTEKELNVTKNEITKQEHKNSVLLKELNSLKEKNNNNIIKLNNDLENEKLKCKNFEEKLNNLLNSKKLEQDNYLKKVEDLKNSHEIKMKELLTTKAQLEADLKFNNEELIVLKMNNDKITSLNNQKFIYLENEINNWKDKYNLLNKDSKKKEDNYKKEILSLKEQIKKLHKENKKDNINSNLFNTNLSNLMKYFEANLKAQNEENKNMFEKMLQAKQKDNENGNELFKNYTDLIAKHSELKIDLNTKENQIKNLEEQISKLDIYKTICTKAKSFQCEQCGKYYSYDIFKDHYRQCSETSNFINNDKLLNKNTNLNGNEENKFIFNPEKLKIKIIKGHIKNDELDKPYLEYIIDINYNTQNFRISKRFIQFANLYKTLTNMFKGNIKMPKSANIFVDFGGSFNGSFHENKIQQLEKFIKDISEIKIIYESKVFKKFLEFNQNFDEENEALFDSMNIDEKINLENDYINAENNERNNNRYIIQSNRSNFNYEKIFGYDKTNE